jgi:hypothetical protein
MMNNDNPNGFLPNRSPENSIIHHLRKMSKSHVNQHLRSFVEGCFHFPEIFERFAAEFEQLRRQQLAYQWLLAAELQMTAYLSDIQSMIKAVHQSGTAYKMDLLHFFDLTRPPVFYVNVNLISAYAALVVKVLCCPGCSNEAGEAMGINIFRKYLVPEAENAATGPAVARRTGR